MGKEIKDVLADQCGNCSHWDPTDRKDGAGECCGVPPTPVLLQATPNKFGHGIDFRFENLRPVMAHNARPCSLHKRKLHFDLGAAKGPASKLDA